MSANMESNGEDPDLTLLSPTSRTARQLKLFWKRGKKFGRRDGTSFQSTESETVVFDSPVSPHAGGPIESDNAVPISGDSHGRRTKRRSVSFIKRWGAFDMRSTRKLRRRSEELMQRETELRNVSSKSDSKAMDRVKDGRRIEMQISLDLDNQQESNPDSHSSTKNHYAARRRRSWIKKLKKKAGRKGQRHSAPQISPSSGQFDSTDHLRPKHKQISFNLSNLHESDSFLSRDENHDSFDDSFKKKFSSKMRKAMNPFKKRGSDIKLNRSNSVRLKRHSNGSISIKSSEFSDHSEGVENFDLSYSIMPRASMRNLMSQRNINPDLLDDMDDEDKVGLLAESRTPSFNIMLHANEFYSDSCTILKRKTVRITWDDLATNTSNPVDEEPEDAARDLGGRKVSDMKFERTSTSSDISNSVFGVRGLRSRGSLLVRQPSTNRQGSNMGGVPLWSGTSTIEFNSIFDSFVLHEKTKDWLKSFKTCDPRHQILTFFNDVANEGATGDSDFHREHVSPLLKYLYRASVFTVWRPTSLDAIRRMMLGEGVGKGLDIKGKSAKRGKLSAFVPFLQIFMEEDKAKVRTLQKDSKIRIFFNSERDRDLVVSNLSELAKELEETVRVAKNILENAESDHDDETLESAMRKMTLDMNDTTINTIDLYTSSNKYGIEVQERLFWEGMVVRQNIYRKPGSRDDIGRTSMPSFQDMNFSSLRQPRNSVPGGHTRAVIMHYNPPGEESNPMNPLNLVMAYEENDPDNNRCRVIPVVSDFDCFIVGTRGVRYEEEVPEDQVKILKWMVEHTKGVLDEPSTDSWTKRWLDVLKEAGTKGFHPKIPTGGYSDPKTRLIFEHAIDRLGGSGAVRHGAECYNYYFPQDLDEELLVISDELPEKYNRCNWTYVNQEELKNILKFKIDKGYTFPLNPKWILCDQGWKEVYDKLKLSDAPNVQQSLNCFYPPSSGITDLIEKIYSEHPEGFTREPFERKVKKGWSGRFSTIDGTTAMDLARQQIRGHLARQQICSDPSYLSDTEGTTAMDLAEQELKYYFVLQRAKNRVRAYLRMTAILNKVRNPNGSSSGANRPDTKEKEQNPCPVENESKDDDTRIRKDKNLDLGDTKLDNIDEVKQAILDSGQVEGRIVKGLGSIDEGSEEEDSERREETFRGSRFERFEQF